MIKNSEKLIEYCDNWLSRMVQRCYYDDSLYFRTSPESAVSQTFLFSCYYNYFLVCFLFVSCAAICLFVNCVVCRALVYMSDYQNKTTFLACFLFIIYVLDGANQNLCLFRIQLWIMQKVHLYVRGNLQKRKAVRLHVLAHFNLVATCFGYLIMLCPNVLFAKRSFGLDVGNIIAGVIFIFVCLFYSFFYFSKFQNLKTSHLIGLKIHIFI